MRYGMNYIYIPDEVPCREFRTFVAQISRSPLFTHILRAQHNKFPWNYEPFDSMGPKQIHQGYENSSWWSYDTSVRWQQNYCLADSKYSKYQFRDPAEEFAELYATYHMTRKKGERVDEKRKKWFEKQGLHKDQNALDDNGADHNGAVHANERLPK